MLESVMYTSVYLFVQMVVVWIFYLRTHNPSIVDVAWPLSLIVSGLIYLNFHEVTQRQVVVSLLLIFWGIRLAGYLWFARIRKGHIDKRYLKLSANWKIAKSLGFFLNFQLQAILAFLISGVFLFVSMRSNSVFSVLDYLGCITVIVGILGEMIADMQLQQFKKHHSGQVCNQGLWRFSRHPNYFFDWVTWCGFTLFALQAHYGYLSLISPLTLLIIFTKITGPMTEQGSIDARGQSYRDYQKRTSFFFPSFFKS